MGRVLFAVLGTSPSVLTETIWALAHETPPVIPDRIVVLTTTVGRQKLLHDLFAVPNPAWERLMAALSNKGFPIAGKLRFGAADAHVRLIPAADSRGNLEDVTGSGDNTVTADFIMRELRAETENPQTQILASIAGGRKTMSALLMSCMSLLGRTHDRVLHVLVNPPYDTPLDPPFIFPEAKLRHKLRDGKSVRSGAAKIELIDVPFVRMRGWYEGAFKSAPPSYATLVAGMQRQAPPAANAPQLTLDSERGELRVAAAETIRLSATEFAAIWLLWQGRQDIAKLLFALRQQGARARDPEWRQRFANSSRFVKSSEHDSEQSKVLAEDLSKCFSSARTKIKAHSTLAPFAEVLLPKRGDQPRYADNKIAFHGPDLFADIRRFPHSPH